MIRNIRKKVGILLIILALAFSLVGCKKLFHKKTTLEKQQEEIYQLAKSSGYDGTYEEWLETIKGVDGTSITKVEINSKGELIITLSNGKTTNLGVVKGTDGEDGIDGKDGVGIKNVEINSKGELIITYTNDQSKNLGEISSSSEGVDIKSIEINTEGELVISLTDGTNKNLGTVKGTNGTDGKDGVGIKDMYISVSGNLIIELTDGSKKDLGKVGSAGSSDIEGVTPVYQGMTLESATIEEATTLNSRRNRKFEDSIKDILDIITTEKVEYYANKNEKFNVCIHLYNPSLYEILSFTLNNYKYQSFEFKEGSTSTKLIVEVDAGQVSGLKEFTIDGIKYIDGTQIKDVQMDGNKTVKAGIRYEIVPTATTIQEQVSTTSYSTVVEVKDDTHLMNQNNGIHFFVFDGQNIVVNQKMSLGINNINVDDLLMGTKYDYMVVGVYDDFSGAGKQAVPLVSGEFTTLSGFALDSFESTQDEISLSITSQDESATFKYVELYLGEEKLSVKEYVDEITFDNLLSNNEYTIKAIYTYQKDGVERTGEIVQNIKTKEKSMPSFTINNLETNKTSIIYNVEESDIDEVKTDFRVYLYKGVSKVAELDTLEGVFENLFSNNEYKVVIEYSYDLNDGAGVLKLTQEVNINTEAKKIPSIDVTYNKKSESLTYGTTKTDEDSVISDITYKLYQGSALIEQTKEESYQFNNLSSNTEYRLEVTYQYDLNDGEGLQTKTNNYNVLLSKQVPSIELTTYFVTQNEMEYNVLITDPNAVGRVNMIALYVDNTFLKRLDETTTLVDSLSANTTYNIRINYVYDLDDGNGSKEINYTYEFTTLKQEPTYAIRLNSKTKSSLDFIYELNDPNGALTFKKLELIQNGKVLNTYTSITSTLFKDLLSDNEYKAVVTFEKDLNNGAVNVTSTVDAKTDAMTKPTVDITLDSTKTEVSYSYLVNDADKVSTLKSIDLYYQGTKLENKAVEKVFSNLYTNSEYEVVITLLNDYHNGKEAVEETYRKTIKTDAYDVPSLTLDLTSTADTINYEFNYFDSYELIKVNKIKVMKGQNVVKEITSFDEKVIKELTSNTLFTLEVEYQYDLNDNRGIIKDTYSKDYSTLAYNVSVIDFELLNSTNPKTNEVVNIKLYFENISKVKLAYLVVNGQKVNIIGGDYYDNAIFTITAPKFSGECNVLVDKMGYILNGLEVEQKVENKVEVTFDVMSRLDIVSVDNPNHLDVWKSSYGHGLIFTIDNPDGYTITEYNINGTIFEVTMIDDNHVYVNYTSNYYMENLFVKSVSYINSNGEIAIRYYNDIRNLGFVNIEGQIEVHKVSTPEDFMNMTGNYYYELTNNIDMSGYDWVPYDFNGYLDGRGYIVSNLSYTAENEYDYTNIGIFNMLVGTIKNVYFKNLYINVQSTGCVCSYLLYGSTTGNVHTTENILIEGDVIFNGSMCDLYMPEGNNIYVVDHLNFNNQPLKNCNIISYEKFNSTEFKENTLGWNFVNNDSQELDGILYTVYDNSYIIINGYNGTNPVLVIPEKIDNLPVIGIEDLAFKGNTTLTSVTFPDTLLYAGQNVLSGCYNIEELIIKEAYVFAVSKSDLRLGGLQMVFGWQPYENSYYQGSATIPNSLKKVTIISKYELQEISLGSYKSIEYLYVDVPNGDVTANDCENLKEVVLENIKTIYTFQNCFSLTSITIPDCVTSIGNYAFFNCESLTSITIPDSVTSIGNDAFSYCESLTSITIPDSVTSIGHYAFYFCTSLTSITIPNSVTSIGTAAFYNCTSLRSITIPDSVTIIGNNAFTGCRSLTSITIPDSVTSIGECAFYNCESLTSITIPNSVTSIGSSAFQDCRNLNTVIFEEGSNLRSIESHTFYNCEKLTDFIIPSEVVYIGREAFVSCMGITEIKIPKNVVSIGAQAFIYCHNLKNVYIEDNSKLTSIDDSAFFNCYILENIDFGKNSILNSIGYLAFSGCYMLEIYIPNTVTIIEEMAFPNAIKVSCETTSKPAGWDDDWAVGVANVYWGVKKPE